MIIRGGENIFPRELEELLFRHPTVAEVAVVGLPDDKWGEEVAAFVRPAPGAAIDKHELIAFMREHLAPHKTPRHWFVVDSFPFTGVRQDSEVQIARGMVERCRQTFISS